MPQAESTIERTAGFPREAYRAYSDWVHAEDRSSRAAYELAKRAYFAGARAEAVARTEGCAPAAVQVMEVVDGFGRWDELADADEATFVAYAANIFVAGQPLRRRLAAAWRILVPSSWWRR